MFSGIIAVHWEKNTNFLYSRRSENRLVEGLYGKAYLWNPVLSSASLSVRYSHIHIKEGTAKYVRKAAGGGSRRHFFRGESFLTFSFQMRHLTLLKNSVVAYASLNYGQKE